MAAALKTRVAPSAARPAKRVVVCQAKAGAIERVQAAAASAVVAALLASPAHAGVVLAKPELKKLFQEDGTAAVTSTSSSSAAPAAVKAAPAPKAKAAPAPKKSEEESSFGSGDIDPRSVALPGSIALVAGGFLAAYKLDSGFAEFMREAVVKDSNNFAGYEPELKPEGGYTGTRKVKASGTKKGGLFGKK